LLSATNHRTAHYIPFPHHSKAIGFDALNRYNKRAKKPKGPTKPALTHDQRAATAYNMRLRKRTYQNRRELNIAPLIDVVFLLIIFFMVVSQFTRVDVQALALPSAHQGQTPSAVPQRLVVNVDQTGQILIRSRVYSLGAFERHLAHLLGPQLPDQPPIELSVLIRADRGSPWRHIQPILSRCASLGLQRVRLAVIEPDLNSDS